MAAAMRVAPSCVPLYSVKLKHKIRSGLVTLGHYDGVHPSLTCATEGGKVFVHNPFSSDRKEGESGGQRLLRGVDAGDYQTLSIQQQVSALLATRRTERHADGEEDDHEPDLLFLGSPSSLLAYDVEKNQEAFYREVADGVNCLTVGSMNDLSGRLVFAGGNCSVQGFNFDGEDSYWTVTGDNVRSMALCDFNMDGENELLVGSEDYDIRIFHNDEMIAELSETEVITGIAPLYHNCFAYSLGSGSVGAYGQMKRYWRIKSRNAVTSLIAFDYDQDGLPEVVSGWSSGKVDARKDRTGELVMKYTMPSGIAGLVEGDYRMDGKDSIVCCTVDGEVAAFRKEVYSEEQKVQEQEAAQQTQLNACREQKQALLSELTALTENVKQREKLQGTSVGGGTGLVASSDAELMSSMPVGTAIDCYIETGPSESDDGPGIRLVVQTTNGALIKAVIIVAEGLFENESHIIHNPPEQMTSLVKVPLLPKKDLSLDMFVKVLVGSPFSKQFHVLEARRVLPKFSMYIPIASSESFELPKSSVKFTIPFLNGDYLEQWVTDHFLAASKWSFTGDIITIKFASLRHNQVLCLELRKEGEVTIWTDIIELAGDVVQSLTAFLHVENLNSEANFPVFEEYFRQCLSNVDEQHRIYQQLRAEIADHSSLIRSLVVRAEDSRIHHDMQGVRQAYKQLQEYNSDLIRGHNVRCTTHDELMAMLRLVNQCIQQAGRLRVGKPKAHIISAAREAIKANDVPRLFKIVQQGKD